MVSINKFFCFSIFLILVIPSFVLAQSSNDALDKILGFEVQIPHPSYVEASGSVPIWLILGLFIVFFSVIYVLTMRLPFFWDGGKMGAGKMYKKPALAFSIALSIVVMVGSNVAEMIFSMIVSLSKIVVLLVFILFLLMMWWLAASSWHAGRGMVNEAAADAHGKGAAAKNAKASEHEARQAEVHARNDLDNQHRMLNRERQSLHNAERGVRGFAVDTGDEIRSLERVLQNLRHITSLRDENSIGQLRTALLHDLSSVASRITHENENIRHLHDLTGRMNASVRNEIRDATDEATVLGHIHTGMGHHPPPNDARAVALAQRFMRLSNARRHLIAQIDGHRSTLETNDTHAVDSIRAAIGAIHSNQFPAAIEQVQRAIQAKTNSRREIQRIRGIEGRAEASIRECAALERDIAHLIAHP